MRRVTLLPVLAGTALLLGAGFTVTVLVPAAEARNTTRTAATHEYTKGQVAGQAVYVNQGCIYCHTQQVRDTFTDAGLAAAPTGPDVTLSDRPGQLGVVRYGPDLACVGDRVPGATDLEGGADLVGRMMAYLRSPASVHPGSMMPGYSYLAEDDLRRLASYLVSLTCEQP